MKKLLAIFLPLFFLNSILHANNDPQATKILDKVSKLYQTYPSLDIQFTFTTKPAESNAISEKGRFSSMGSAYKIILPAQEIYNNGNTQWTYLKKNKEIQIIHAQESSNFYHPQNLTKLYKSGKYEYQLDGSIMLKGQKLMVIDFKPIDREDPVFKTKFFINPGYQITKVELFNKNGERSTLEFTKIKTDTHFDAQHFFIPESLLSSNHVEDLRE